MEKTRLEYLKRANDFDKEMDEFQKLILDIEMGAVKPSEIDEKFKTSETEVKEDKSFLGFGSSGQESNQSSIPPPPPIQNAKPIIEQIPNKEVHLAGTVKFDHDLRLSESPKQTRIESIE